MTTLRNGSFYDGFRGRVTAYPPSHLTWVCRRLGVFCVRFRLYCIDLDFPVLFIVPHVAFLFFFLPPRSMF